MSLGCSMQPAIRSLAWAAKGMYLPALQSLQLIPAYQGVSQLDHHEGKSMMAARYFCNSKLGSLAESKPDVSKELPLPIGQLKFKPISGMDLFWTSWRLYLDWPWRSVKQDSVLTFKLEGSISEQSRPSFDPGVSIPQVCSALQKAALDPRVKGIMIEIGPLAIGWAKLQELRRYILHFKESGKFNIAYLNRASEKEYYLATAFDEVYMPPSASLSLRGFSVSGQFLRGVLDKLGVEPQVQRIGKYKSAGDQLLRKDMSEAQAEQLNAILEDISEEFVSTVAQAKGKTKEEVWAMMDEGIIEMSRFLKEGWLTGLKYEDEVLEDMKGRTGGKKDEVRSVTLRKYSAVPSSLLKMGGKQRIAVLRTAGMIIGSSKSPSGTITTKSLIKELRALGKDKKVKAVVLRIESPGGDALASDLMWREIGQLGLKKPVVGSMGDVAASGGYFLAMACSKVLAEPLTMTGSIGVVAAKFSLGALYQKLGFSKTILSKGRYAELMADHRSLTKEEEAYFVRGAEHAYATFRDKAASSRGMEAEAMDEVAQGRVWTGKRALEAGLIDGLGGVDRAIAVAKQLANIPEHEAVTIIEKGRTKPNFLALLEGRSRNAFDPGLLLWMLFSRVAHGLVPMPAAQPAFPQVNSMSALDNESLHAMKLLSELNPCGTLFTDLHTQAQHSSTQYMMVDVDAATVGGLMQPDVHSTSNGDSSGSFMCNDD